MIAMQYDITLPADYDMQIIRDRVSATGYLLDEYPGLGLKAFLVRERGTDGASANQYAPFYLWRDAAGAASFLWSGIGFTSILRDFGRPQVQTWVGGTVHQRREWTVPPTHATRRRTSLASDVDVVELARVTDVQLAEAVRSGSVLLGAYGIDPRTWELVTFTLHGSRPAGTGADAEVFQVLHASAPERLQLPTRVDTRIPTPR